MEKSKNSLIRSCKRERAEQKYSFNHIKHFGGGGQRNPSVAFDELDKLIFCKIWDEKHPRKTKNHTIFNYLGEKIRKTY